MADYDQAFNEVLAWVRDVTEASPALGPIVGISDAELRQLARLGQLLIGKLGADAPAPLVEVLTADGVDEVPGEVRTGFDRLIETDAVVRLADLYAAVVSPEHRRPLGTFFTPRDAAQAIVNGYISRHEEPAEVVDVGAGVGIFSEIARAAWPSATIQAVDVNPLTLGLQAVAAAGRPEWNVRLELEDYRCWLEARGPSRPTLYLGNPPYTRWQLIAKQDRTKLLDAAVGLVGARANLSTLFLAMTLAKLRAEDSLAMIIPAGWMRADYGKKLRSHLRAATHRRVSLRLADSWRFDQAIVDAVLVEVGPVGSEPQQIEVSDWSSSELHLVSRTDGEAPFPAPGRSHLSTPDLASSAMRLGEFAYVTRGTASGAHTFFVKRCSEWDALGIPKQYRKVMARRLRPSGGVEPALETAELLVLDGYQHGDLQEVDDWITAGKTAGIDDLHLCGKRRRWFDLSSEVKTPDAIVSALARNVFHVIPNADGLTITNNLFGLFWKVGLDDTTKDRVVQWLRSSPGQAALRASSSVEANGLHRLSPKAIGEIEVPDLSLASGDADLGLTELVSAGGRSK